MTDQEVCEHLKQDIVARVGRTMESPADFNYLSHEITLKTGEAMSASTLKRLFGYITLSGKLSNTSLSILSRYVGYAGWMDYKQHDASESGFVASKKVLCEDLSVGDRVHFEWKPDRVCVAEYLGERSFKVVSRLNCKLQVDDFFNATQFLLDNPLFLSGIHHLGQSPETGQDYMAGSKSGLTKLKVIHRNDGQCLTPKPTQDS